MISEQSFSMHCCQDLLDDLDLDAHQSFILHKVAGPQLDSIFDTPEFKPTSFHMDKTVSRQGGDWKDQHQEIANYWFEENKLSQLNQFEFNQHLLKIAQNQIKVSKARSIKIAEQTGPSLRNLEEFVISSLRFRGLLLTLAKNYFFHAMKESPGLQKKQTILRRLIELVRKQQKDLQTLFKRGGKTAPIKETHSRVLQTNRAMIQLRDLSLQSE